MNIWVSRLLRWIVLLLSFSAMSLCLYLFGLYIVPSLVPWDQSISLAVNPDNYVPFVDEFFRALTDYSNLVMAVPLISLGIATMAYRLSLLSRRRTWTRSVLACLVCWVALGLLRTFLDIPIEAVYVLGVLPLLVALGAGPRLLFESVDTKRWITALLALEALVFVGLWATKRLFWNVELVGANFLLLPGLLVGFGGMVYWFHQMNPAAMLRFQKIFLLVLLTILLVSRGATDISKEVIARPRPLSDLNKPWNEQLRPIPEEHLRGSNSYPSGHTSGTFALITPFFWWFRDRRARAGLLGLGALQGVSRVYTVAHFASDCVMGAAIGFGTGTLVFFLLGGPASRPPDEESPTALGVNA